MNNQSSVLVSIIIPVFNVEQYLRPCLDSVVNQSLRVIEIICVNDGSEDSSSAILHEYAEKDTRIKVIDKANEGQAVARNLALLQASGEYIVFVDSDDIVNRDLCRKVYEIAKRNNSDMVMYDFTSFKDVSEISSKAEVPSSLSAVDSSDRKTLLMQMGVVWTKCVRSDFIRSNMIKFPEGRIYEDIFVHWQFIILAKKIVILPERLYNYRMQPFATTYRKDWKITDRVFILDMVYDCLHARNLYETYRDVFLHTQLDLFCGLHDNIDPSHRTGVIGLILDRLHEEHWIYIDTSRTLTWKTRDFYHAIQGSYAAKLRRAVWFFARDCYRNMKRMQNHLLVGPDR